MRKTGESVLIPIYYYDALNVNVNGSVPQIRLFLEPELISSFVSAFACHRSWSRPILGA
jgi:hypothetical protein